MGESKPSECIFKENIEQILKDGVFLSELVLITGMGQLPIVST